VELTDGGGEILAYNERWAIPFGSKDPIELPLASDQQPTP
jgi:hypothetical protein